MTIVIFNLTIHIASAPPQPSALHRLHCQAVVFVAGSSLAVLCSITNAILGLTPLFLVLSPTYIQVHRTITADRLALVEANREQDVPPQEEPWHGPWRVQGEHKEDEEDEVHKDDVEDKKDTEYTVHEKENKTDVEKSTRTMSRTRRTRRGGQGGKTMRGIYRGQGWRPAATEGGNRPYMQIKSMPNLHT